MRKQGFAWKLRVLIELRTDGTINAEALPLTATLLGKADEVLTVFWIGRSCGA